MKAGQKSPAWYCPSGLRWVSDRDQLLVIDPQRQICCRLQGVEAIVWGWLMSAYSYSKMVRLLGNLLALPSSEAEGKFQTMLQGWRQAGVLAVELGEDGQLDRHEYL